MPGNALIGNLAVNLTMETAAFQRGATIAEKRANAMQGRFSAMTGTMKTFAVGFAGGLAAGVVPAITGVVSSAFQMASSLQEASEKVGVTVEALQELRFAANQSGVSSEQLETSVVRLNKSLGALQLGSKPAVDAFAQIGLSADDLRGKRPEEAMRLIADGLNKIPDAATRAAVGQAIFGRGYAQLIPLINGGSEALNRFAEESRKNGQISTEDAKKLDELADGWDKLKIRVGVATVNIIGDLAKLAQGTDNDVRAFWKMRDEAIASFHAMRDSVVASVTGMVSDIAGAITGRLSAIWEGAKRKVQEFADKAKWLWDVVTRNSYIPDMVTEIGYEMGPRLAEVMAPAAATIGRTATAFQENATEMAEGTKRTTAEIIDGFGQMAVGTIGAVRSMVDTFKSGDVLSGIQQFLQLVLNVVQALGQIGVIKLPGGQTPTPRAQGGPVSPGRPYLVGERGPEIVSFGRRGFVHPNKGNAGQLRLQIVPSPMFDVVVEDRATRVAAPMVGQGMMMAAGGTMQASARRQRRMIP